MKKVLNLLLIVCVICNMRAQTPPMGDSTFYYLPDGSKSWLYYQRDVAVFRYNGGVAYAASLPLLVTSIKWDNTDPHGYNIITWDSSASHAMIDIQNAYLAGDPLFEYGFIPVTLDKNAYASANKWYMGSDLINIRFKLTASWSSITSTFLDQFTTRNGLVLYHRPDASLTNADSWTWVFRLTGNDRFLPFEACARIWSNEQAYNTVTHVEPDMQFFRQETCTLPNEFAAWGATSYPDALWHIKNNGNVVYTTLGSGTAGADAKICECWGDGYHGQGVKVAVIDDGGYDYTHPDMVGQYLPGYDFINMTSFSTSHYANVNEHGMMVASVIAAIPNGGQLPSQPNNTSVVGVAYDCQILPYISNLGNTNLAMAVQRAVADGADVINLSNSTAYPNFQSTPLYNDILAAVSTGRSGLGAIVCSSTGNDDASLVNWPAAMVDVIGVGATDENDFRGSWTQTNPWTWSTNFGSDYITSATPTLRYDVVAPGTDIRIAYTSNGPTSPVQNSSAGTGTSFSSPIVAGIAAIILEKYPTAPYQQVISMIDFTADKVKSGTTYNYSAYSAIPGYAEQTFYGRVDCKAALNNPTVGLKETTKSTEGVKMLYLDNDNAMIMFNKGTNANGYTLNIYDVSGRQMRSERIDAEENTHTVNTVSLSKGVYLFNLVSSDRNNDTSIKYIK